jgi:hypothetical protein
LVKKTKLGDRSDGAKISNIKNKKNTPIWGSKFSVEMVKNANVKY